jgi:bis(5'-nucleosyl)-tetraphosphatase (symmetrical)
VERAVAAGAGSTWVIGDVHGCSDTLSRLLERAEIDLERDRLILIGDLVNRGPRSLDVLRWARARARTMGPRFEAVLGNHDLHLLALARGVRQGRLSDTLDEILAAPDRVELLDWLRRRPLALLADGALIVHAGVEPSWTVEETLQRARALSTALQGPEADALLRRSARSSGRNDDTELTPSLAERQRDLATLTRLRMLDARGRPDPYTGPPGEAPPGRTAWFDVPGRRTAGTTVVFGHWAALGLYVADALYGIDSGCAWGRRLTALRLADRVIVQQDVSD